MSYVKPFRPNNSSMFKIGKDYYELPKKMIRANGNIYHIFQANKFRDFQVFYQYNASRAMTLNEFKILTGICWDRKTQPLTIDI